ncbi:MAG: undecaprenyl/decaprenyl-phosphate alpha-N-acetylglucosaminyl 1-phosphate transferase [Chlamydiae bacterium]|nr:undecaprenyl/decaprenyl-phosphate alpha-N-acetylglucosaminyl 1-phosphate transferase [Chlamydiota bacterium]MBI3267258.1 undecaprenyl/decaprenyl-phosphate alpha-N-acetylglucosaminyl 1-phosphate transferase [Chlamydiota bacterium]
MWSLVYIYLLLFSFAVSWLCVHFCARLALKLNLMDEPGPRKIQKKSIPLLGGLGMILAFVITVWISLVLLKIFSHHAFFLSHFPTELLRYVPGVLKVSHKLWAIAWGSFLVFLVGLVDDFRELGAWPKLIVQIIAASLLFFAGVRITIFSSHLMVSLPLTVLWVVAITNAFNLLDNMDGLSAGIAWIGCFFLLVITASQNQYFVSVLICVLMGALGGFLKLNFNPAKIFMGDAGSYWIGYLMASVTLLATYYGKGNPNFFSVLKPVFILGVPLYDLCSVILIRLYQGRSIFEADRQHFSHRLIALGMGQGGAVLFLYLLSFSFGTSSLFLEKISKWQLYFVGLQALSFVSIIALLEYFGRKRENSST